MADIDVVIIGAGAAGLAAASTLVREGYSVAVVEARERIGGRIHTIRVPGATLPIELGADFVHGRPPETFSLAAEAGIRLYEHTGNSWAARDGRFNSERFFDEDESDDDGNDDSDDDSDDEDNGSHDASSLGAIFAAIRSWQEEDRSLQSLLDERFAGKRWQTARQRIRGYAEGFDAAALDRVSVAWLRQTELASDALDGDRQYRVLDGYDRLMDALAGRITDAGAQIHLEHVARELRWQRGEVTLRLETPTGTNLPEVTAHAAIVTLPLGVLKRSFEQPDAPGAMDMQPEPPGKRALLGLLEMGHALKVVLRLSDVFWDALPGQPPNTGVSRPKLPQLPGFSFLFSDDPVLPTWWTMQPVVAPMLVGWAAGPRAASLANASTEELADGALNALARVLGLPRAALEHGLLVGSHVHNWSADPFSSGAYSYVAVGGLDAPAALAEPVEDTLFFAGEATNADGNTGTVHAALSSGYLAAAAVSRALGPSGKG